MTHDEQAKAVVQPRPENAPPSYGPSGEKSGYVYFVTDASGLYKIGRAKDPLTRFRQMRWGNTTAKLVGARWTLDMYAAEAALHKRYARHREAGEWFRLDAQTVEAELQTLG